MQEPACMYIVLFLYFGVSKGMQEDAIEPSIGWTKCFLFEWKYECYISIQLCLIL